MQGSVQIPWIIDTNVRSLILSLSCVIASSVKIWKTCEGITSKFVLKVLNPKLFNVSVKYVAGGDWGIYATSPIA